MLLSSALRGGRRGRDQENSNSAAHGGRQRQDPRGTIVRGIASGIGLAAEAYHHRKEKNAQKVKDGTRDPVLTSEPATSGDSNTQSATLSQQVDEAAWQLDDAQQQVMEEDSPPPYHAGDEHPPEPAETFLQRHSQPPAATVGAQQLALPVVITQRRPGKRTRGFIRAYAPVLNDVGINETTFLEFIDDLNKAVMPNPWIQAVNLASLAGMAVPEPFSILISIAVQQAANAASAVHSRFKTNHFLNQVNKSFFMPRGLIALIMTWKPSQPGEMLTTVNFDMDPAITTAANESEQSSWRKKLAESSGTTPFEWPETAPLVFPVLDNIAAADAEKKQNALKRTGAFVEGYMDSRSRAKWAGQNPNSKMANTGPKEQFHSRYSDPNHPASSGDPVALLTGGHFQSFLAGGHRGAFPRRVGRMGYGSDRLTVGGGGVVGVGADAVRKIFEKVIAKL
ncbi:hypothetical protein EKO27_g5185 [Xylaria grammica]|uniref:Uncharacterized protein n=1 Tax=Xylaria grammica TaxID=363999 RepID=A0A439D694_9PEZI|nr:hypothetical protein EKO27_g5185 [Xylaria grammica]